MEIWQAVSPIVVLLISLGFTIWQTRMLRKEDKTARYKDLYLNEVNGFADNIIDICNRIAQFVVGSSYGKLKADIEVVSKDGSRLYFVEVAGRSLREQISAATELLASLTTEVRYDTANAEKLKRIADQIKDEVSSQRHGSK